MSQFQVRFYRGEDPASSSWLVTEVLRDDGEGNRTSDIRAEFDPTPDGREQARDLADALNRELEQEIYAEFG
jgi:hypothetical protein